MLVQKREIFGRRRRPRSLEGLLVNIPWTLSLLSDKHATCMYILIIIQNVDCYQELQIGIESSNCHTQHPNHHTYCSPRIST